MNSGVTLVTKRSSFFRTSFALFFSLQLLVLSAELSASDQFNSESCSRLLETKPLFDSQIHSRYEKLALEIATRRSRVPEFESIRKEAQKRGLRVWLFGGTAASFAHYVRWDTLREQGDSRFQSDRFDYDYTNIYRSTQDLDLVVDGNSQDASEFQEVIKSKFPYFFGSKSADWEVRSLRENSHNKGALLGDFGFLNQHSDSNSTGMIELSDPPTGESVIRDLRDWKNTQDPSFLKDITDRKLTFYYSPRHFETPLAKAGKNPPILSVIRALTKVFQYELKISDDDLDLFEKEVQQFDPQKVILNRYTASWIERNGKKLFQHAVNLEYAWDILERLGLRKKLILIRNNPQVENSLSWWMKKEPLRSYPVGQGSGRTAGELGIDIVAHETSDFLAFESITRSHIGAPNVLISRPGAANEEAMYGRGFYTVLGKKGARETGITIRFQVNPYAREGTDFHRVDHNFIIWKNKNALRVIPENIHMSPLEYFQFQVTGRHTNIKLDEESDQAIFWKIERKIKHTIASGQISQQDLDTIRSLIPRILESKKYDRAIALEEWFKIEGGRLKKSPEEVNDLISSLHSHRFRIDPAPFFSAVIEFSKGTILETYLRQKWLPSQFLKLDLENMENQALEKCLFSDYPELQKVAEKMITGSDTGNPNYYLKALRTLRNHSRNPSTNDSETAKQWLKTPTTSTEEIDEKLAYLLVHPEYKEILSEAELRSIKPALTARSNLSLFEKVAKRHFTQEIKTESFEFKSFVFPEGGIQVQLGDIIRTPHFFDIENQYKVTLTKSFEMQTTPVTQLQWALIMGTNPSYFNFSKSSDDVYVLGNKEIEMNPNRPVEQVDWHEVQKFIRRLNSLDPDYTYRLPTEAEWEFVARSGSHSPFFFGNDPDKLSEYAWYAENSHGETHDVASLKPNPNGIYDMHGNVDEWVEDRWDLFRPSNAIDPHGPKFGSKSRVTRGGSFEQLPQYLRSAHRSNENPYWKDHNLGFRLVRTPKTRGFLGFWRSLWRS